MFTTCGKPKLSENNLKHLCTLGLEIHAGNQPLVFDGGFVSLIEQRGSEVNKHAESNPGSRPETRSRQGQRASRRSRSSGQAESFRSRTVEDAFGTGFRLLAQHYDALSVEDKNGLWIAVKTKPLGPGGPQAHLLIAFPTETAISPRAWAFNSLGSTAELFPLKHTNFPDASICAFTKTSLAWTAKDGLLALVDHYALWIVKSWHRTVFGWWPGLQVGACALYRRKEFVGREFCGCESGRRYEVCHQFIDLQVPEDLARQQFRRLFLTNYEKRQPPIGVLQAAQARWNKMPDMAIIYSLRHCHDEPQIILE